MNKKHTNKGFTIIELMIATSVFAIVLVIAASGILTIGRMYYKSITSSRTQETARSVVETISSTLQLTTASSISTGGSFPGAQSICFGQDRYTYIINSQVTGPGVIGLRYDPRPTLNDCSPIASGGTELLSENMRLLDFRVASAASDTYRINVKVAHGDNDLISTYDDSGNPIGGSGHPNETESRAAQCKPGIAASSFCAISELETVINNRVE